MRTLLTSALSVGVVMAMVAAGSTAAERPNILFCIADDASYPHMGAYGTKWVKTTGFFHKVMC